MQISTSPQTTMAASHHSVFYSLDALPVAQPTVLKHWRQKFYLLLQHRTRLFVTMWSSIKMDEQIELFLTHATVSLSDMPQCSNRVSINKDILSSAILSQTLDIAMLPWDVHHHKCYHLWFDWWLPAVYHTEHLLICTEWRVRHDAICLFVCSSWNLFVSYGY